ncbi:MAG TPA: co-chaperone GroES [Actinomycetota bacterium]|nr:co-chaperone GroES [Candidatus Acidoferrum sp.]HYU56923.1 co-chaperone GroES [Actinomycetota bacterium]
MAPRTASRTSKLRAAAKPEPRQPVRLTSSRVLVKHPEAEGERRSKAGLLIPATAASVSRKCIWSEVVAVGPEVRGIEAGDRVLFLPDAGLDVEVLDEDYLLLRERDIHAVASERIEIQTGLYL